MKNSLLTRILCLVMVLAFGVLAVACGETEDVSETASSATSQTESKEEEKFVLFSNLPEKNYGGKEFVVLVEGDYMNTYRSIELVPQAESYSGLNTAIQTRNDLISEKFGVEIVEERTAADGENQLWSTDLSGSIALVIGSEGDGMGRLVRESCDFIISLPMRGKLNSLNASTAAAITMYEILRQRSL